MFAMRHICRTIYKSPHNVVVYYFMETSEGKIAYVEAMGNTFIDGYAIPNAWVDLVNHELSAADVLAMVVSYGGHVQPQPGFDVPTEARMAYNRQVQHESEYGEASFVLEAGRNLAARNRMLREKGREVPFDDRFKWPIPNQAT